MSSCRSRDLFIVARSDAALYTYLVRCFGGRPDVEVISDRRYGERRWRHDPTATERRGAARRLCSVAAELVEFGFAIVTVLQ
jgi:hypothetical protein